MAKEAKKYKKWLRDQIRMRECRSGGRTQTKMKSQHRLVVDARVENGWFHFGGVTNTVIGDAMHKPGGGGGCGGRVGVEEGC